MPAGALEPHDPRWEARLRAEATALGQALGPVAVHHIGSTSVGGLLAKPIVDVLVVVRGLEPLDRCRPAREREGFRWRGEHGIPGRRYLDLFSSSPPPKSPPIPLTASFAAPPTALPASPPTFVTTFTPAFPSFPRPAPRSFAMSGRISTPAWAIPERTALTIVPMSCDISDLVEEDPRAGHEDHRDPEDDQQDLLLLVAPKIGGRPPRIVILGGPRG